MNSTKTKLVAYINEFAYFLMTDTGGYVCIDENSGGYPYVSNTVTSVKFWRTSNEAEVYRKAFATPAYSHYKAERWVVMKLINLEVCVNEM